MRGNSEAGACEPKRVPPRQGWSWGLGSPSEHRTDARRGTDDEGGEGLAVLRRPGGAELLPARKIILLGGRRRDAAQINLRRYCAVSLPGARSLRSHGPVRSKTLLVHVPRDRNNRQQPPPTVAALTMTTGSAGSAGRRRPAPRGRGTSCSRAPTPPARPPAPVCPNVPTLALCDRIQTMCLTSRRLGFLSAEGHVGG